MCCTVLKGDFKLLLSENFDQFILIHQQFTYNKALLMSEYIGQFVNILLLYQLLLKHS